MNTVELSARAPTSGADGEGPSGAIERRSFLKALGTAAAALSTGALTQTAAYAQANGSQISKGDAAILRFAAAEIIESDIWLQYQELGGVQDNEVSTLASKLIPGYPATAYRRQSRLYAGLTASRRRHVAVHSRQHRR